MQALLLVQIPCTIWPGLTGAWKYGLSRLWHSKSEKVPVMGYGTVIKPVSHFIFSIEKTSIKNSTNIVEH